MKRYRVVIEVDAEEEHLVQFLRSMRVGEGQVLKWNYKSVAPNPSSKAAQLQGQQEIYDALS